MEKRGSFWGSALAIAAYLALIVFTIRKNKNSGKPRRRYRRLFLAVFFCLGFIAFFSWMEYRTDSFYWWHVYTLVGVLIVAILAKIFPAIGQIPGYVMKYIGFAKDSPGSVSGVRRSYFIALVPLYFIMSAYLMQAAIRSGELDEGAMILSIVILIFALFLVIVAFLKAIPEAWARITYQLASWLSPVGALVFAIDVINATGKLAELGANPLYVQLFLYGGFLIVFGIFLFFVVSISSGES